MDLMTILFGATIVADVIDEYEAECDIEDEYDDIDDYFDDEDEDSDYYTSPLKFRELVCNLFNPLPLYPSFWFYLQSLMHQT